MNERDLCFCQFVCSEFVESDNNSWGDTSVYYICKKEKVGKISDREWNNLKFPTACIYKETYDKSTKKQIDLLSEIGMYNKIISRLKKERDEILDIADRKEKEICENFKILRRLEREIKNP